MIHYLVLAHKSPEQLEMLAQSLSSKNSKIYIHIDGYSDLNVFQENNYLAEFCVFIKKNIKIRWWWFSIVQATINWLQQIKEDRLDEEDYVVILSGQDFPIKSQDFINTYLNNSKSKSFIEYRPQPNENRNILNRVIKYHFHDLVIPRRCNIIIERMVWIFYNIKSLGLRNQISCYVMQRIVNFFMPLKKYFVKECQLYRWSQRQIINGKHIHYILSHLKTSQGIRTYKEFKYTAGPDELFFQTILLNSPYKNDIANIVQRYIDRKSGPWFPRVLDESDYDNVSKSDKLFARKFELWISNSLMQKILSSFS